MLKFVLFREKNPEPLTQDYLKKDCLYENLRGYKSSGNNVVGHTNITQRNAGRNNKVFFY